MTKYLLDESEDGYGRVLVLCDQWSQSLEKTIAKESINVIRLSDSMGWRGSLDFLGGLCQLSGVEIYSWNVQDVSVIEGLSRLRLVALECDLKKDVDFGRLRELETVKVTWKKALESLFACRTLKHLNIVNFPDTELSRLRKMTRLQWLQLTSRKLISVEHLSSLSRLTWLDLYDCRKLASLVGVASVAELDRFEMVSCKGVKTLEELSKLKKLTTVVLDNCGEIESLVPLRNSEGLKYLSFSGDTVVIDGDLSFLTQMTKLETLIFTPRRHYSHAREDLVAN